MFDNYCVNYHHSNSCDRCFQDELKGYVSNPTAERSLEILRGIQITHLALTVAVGAIVWIQINKSQLTGTTGRAGGKKVS
jgi:hypothetical protein